MADAISDLQKFLDSEWNPDLSVGEWWEKLGTEGWSAPAWPSAWYGRDLSREETSRAAATVGKHGALGAPGGLGLHAGRTDDRHPRHRRAEAALPPRHRHRPAGLVPALQRARRRLRPRRPRLQGRQGRRGVDHQRPEGVDVRRPGRRPRHADRPDRSRAAEAPGHHLVRLRHEAAGRRRPAPPGDDGPGPLQRGVPRGRPRPRQRDHRRPQQRLEGRQHHPHVRAVEPRLRRPRRHVDGDARPGGRRPRQAGRRLRARAGRRRRRPRRHARRRLPAHQGAGEGQRQDRGGQHPPGAHEAATRSASWAGSATCG